MKTKIIVAVAGIIGILLGVGAQHIFSQLAESAKHYQELRTKSYVDFIKATAMIAIAQKNQNLATEIDGQSLMADAKARISIYGSKEVVARASEFFRGHGALTSHDAYASFVAIIAAMRADTLDGEMAIPNADIGQLILSQDVQ